MTWALRIETIPPSGNIIKRMKWPVYAKLLRQWFWLVRAAPGFIDTPEASCRRKLTISLHGKNSRDRDNLYSSMKPVIDVLRPSKHEEGYIKSGPRKGEYWSRHRIGLGLIQDDDTAHLELVVQQLPLPRGQNPYLVLELQDLPTGQDVGPLYDQGPASIPHEGTT